MVSGDNRRGQTAAWGGPAAVRLDRGRPAPALDAAAVALGGYTPFPVEALPLRLRELAVHGAASIGCDPAFVAVPGLAALAGAVGGTRVVLARLD